jgi:cellulose biosynthesis protein BcsQ
MMAPIALSSDIHQLPTPTNSWEDLNQQAKQVENDLDVNLVQLSRSLSPQLITLIEASLAHLTSIIDAQTGLLSSQGLSLPGNAVNTVQRHRDILAEYQREFKRTRSIVETKGNNSYSAQTNNFLFNNDTSKTSLLFNEEAKTLNNLNDSTDHVIE